MIAIIDYGMGNIHSVQKALQLQGAETCVTSKSRDIRLAAKVVLPGVGAFDDAVMELERQELIPAIKEHIKLKKPFLGICLGMQLLFDASFEAEKKKGLGIINGVVKRFDVKPPLKVPHMGWNQLKANSKLKTQNSKLCPLLQDIPDGSYVYFCHSYYPLPKDAGVVAATCGYGVDFAAIVSQDNIFGVQFHPEKSQSIGLRMLRNFVEL